MQICKNFFLSFEKEDPNFDEKYGVGIQYCYTHFFAR